MVVADYSSTAIMYLSAIVAVRAVDGAAAGVARGVIHDSVRSAHGVIELLHAVAASVTAHRQVPLQRAERETDTIGKSMTEREREREREKGNERERV